MFLISIIIPVKNGEATLARCLNTIINQTIASQVEIIILDSCSIDKSKETAKSYDARVIAISNGTFDHGLTRNIGVQHASAPLVFFTTQDAYLSQVDHLENMFAHFNDLQL